MGLIARILGSEKGDDNETVTTVEAHYGENKYCDLYSGSGDDAPPLEEDRVVLVDIEGTGNFVTTSVLSKSVGAQPGEKIIYSRDKDGNVVAKIWLKNDGSIEVKADKPVSVDAEKVVINGGDEGGSAAARKDDTVEVEIPAQTVVVAVSGGSGSPAVGTMNVAAIKLQGKITSGSNKVEIG